MKRRGCWGEVRDGLGVSGLAQHVLGDITSQSLETRQQRERAQSGATDITRRTRHRCEVRTQKSRQQSHRGQVRQRRPETRGQGRRDKKEGN